MAQKNTDLFGGEIPEEPVRGKDYWPAKGYAGTPGAGPQGETCKSCAFYFRREMGSVYRKCLLLRDQWTHGLGTDIRAGSPACEHWKEKKDGDK